MNTSEIRSIHQVPGALHSKRSLIASLLITTLAVVFILFSMALFAIAIYFLIAGSEEPFGLWLFLLAIAVVMNGLCFYAWKRYKKTAYTQVRINEEGLHYYNHLSDKTALHFKWADFQKNPDKNGFDVVLHTTYGYVNNARVSADWILWWFKEGDKIKSHQENFKGGHVLYMIRNSKELIGKCLQMLTYHRPDLKIDPRLFSTFFIDKKTFTFERRIYIKTWAVAMVFIVVILVLIDCWTKYRFGYTLFLDLLFFD